MREPPVQFPKHFVRKQHQLFLLKITNSPVHSMNNILNKDSSVDVDKVCDFCDLVSLKKDITGFITDWKIITPILLLFST